MQPKTVESARCQEYGRKSGCYSELVYAVVIAEVGYVLLPFLKGARRFEYVVLTFIRRGVFRVARVTDTVLTDYIYLVMSAGSIDTDAAFVGDA